MPTVEAPEIDWELLELVADDPEDECCEDGCETRAAWVLTCRSCALPYPLCDRCYNQTRALIEVGGWNARCLCGSAGLHLPDVFIVVRLRVS